MRYKIENIPKPSAKRLEKDRRLIIKVHGSWYTTNKAEYPIPEGDDAFEFEMDGPIEHRDPDVLDGDYYHEFIILYQNSTGSRREEVRVSPKEIGG